MAPIIKLMKCNKNVKTIICSTGQHREMLSQVLNLFKLKIDYDLNMMKSNQDLFDISINSLSKLKSILKKINPDILLVQGDTSTAFISALAAYYSKIKIGHVEAGLRSYNIMSPYPEEANRRFISTIADLHFAPTSFARDNLLREGVDKRKVHLTGNTVVDSLGDIKEFLRNSLISEKLEKNIINFSGNHEIFRKKIILITMHRREKFGEEFRNHSCHIKIYF